MIDGFVLVDKPGGWTSHDVVGKLRRLAGQKKVGHAGTLDPMATGLVVVGLGRCTRLLRFFQGQPKVYEAVARFGIATTSLDADGEETERAPQPVTAGMVEAVLGRFRGEIRQIPPMVSAIKRDGRRLYEMAREGIEVEREARAVVIHELDVTSVGTGDHPDVGFTVTCGSGTYIRTLADDIARALGGRAHLVALRRTRNGGHSVETAFTIEELERADDFASMVLTPLDGLPELPLVTVGNADAARVANGVAIDATGMPENVDVRLVHDDRLLAVYRTDGERARAEVVLG